MSDSLRTDPSRAFAAASEADRDAKIEQLLLVGLDHYFATQYDQAINVWTRALFLDRTHARARAYIERARSALAERQRESEELLQSGVAAFQRGEGGEARRLLQAAIDRGAPTDEALAVLDRLNRVEASTPASPPFSTRRQRREVAESAARSSSAWSGVAVSLMLGLASTAAAVYFVYFGAWRPLDWRSLFALEGPPARASAPAVAHDTGIALPRRGELALARARALAAQGHLRDALTTLDLVRPTDPQTADADRLRGEIQRQLIALTVAPAQPVEKGDRRVP